MGDAVKTILRPVASLKLTVALFAMSVFIVLAGTVAQIDKGISTVLDEYFRCFGTWIDLSLFFPRNENWAFLKGFGFPFPGGWLIGAALMINIITAHLIRFRIAAKGARLTAGLLILTAGGVLTWLIVIGVFSQEVATTEGAAFWRVLYRLIQGGGAAAILLAGCWLVFKKRAGIVLLHSGVLLLLVHEVFTGVAAVEGTMRINPGQTINYLTHSSTCELAIIDRSDPEFDDVRVVPRARLRRMDLIQDDKLPFDIAVVQYMKNSMLVRPQPGATNRATAGSGLRAVAIEEPETSGVDTEQTINIPSVYATLTEKGTGEAIGTYLFSVFLDGPQWPPQLVTVGEKTYEIELRFGRTYKPYSIQLVEFRHDKYVGTQKAKNFSSLVRLVDERRGVDRTVKIWMNNPLRYAGETFYQSSFEPGKKLTILQVVRNDGWMLPYLACMIVGAGLTLQFGYTLVGFLRRKVTL